MNEKFEKTRYEVHYQSVHDKKWRVLYRTANTFEEAEGQMVGHKKSEKNLNGFITVYPPMGYKIIKVESKCEVIKIYENCTT